MKDKQLQKNKACSIDNPFYYRANEAIKTELACGGIIKKGYPVLSGEEYNSCIITYNHDKGRDDGDELL